MTDQMLSIPTPDGDMGAYVRRPDGDGPFPVIVYFHHGPGLDDGSKESMQLLADAGYYVVSPDRYHREEPWLVFDLATLRGGGPEGEKAMQQMFGILMATTDDMVESDLTALLAALDKEPTARKAPMGVIGFCIGARSVMRTVAAHPDIFTAGVALHPSFCTTEDADSPHLGVAELLRAPVRRLRLRGQDAVGRRQQAVHRRGEHDDGWSGPGRDPRRCRPRLRRARTCVSRCRGRPFLREGARDLRARQSPDAGRHGTGDQDAGRRLRAASRGLQVVHRRGSDRRRPRLRLRLDERASLRGRRVVALAAADPRQHRRAHVAHPAAHERVPAAAAPPPARRPRTRRPSTSSRTVVSTSSAAPARSRRSSSRSASTRRLGGAGSGRRWRSFAARSTGEPFTFEGKHFTIPQPIRQTTKPVQDPFPLWVGGLGSKLQYNSGKRGFHAQGGPVFRPEYLEGLKEAGIDPMTRNLSMFVSGHLAATKEQGVGGVQGRLVELAERVPQAHLDRDARQPDEGGASARAARRSSTTRRTASWRRCSARPTTSSRALVPMLEGAQCTHFSFAFRASGGGMPNDVVRPGIELFAKEILPVLKTLGREPVTSRRWRRPR